MSLKRFLLLCATTGLWFAVAAQNGGRSVKIPHTRFTCQGRASGYYADVETGCQVYHMCDGLGRQFSYTCPNTTLFQQRMLICDHWYMVNCSKSESDYDANLLIGQRNKPFVSEAEMQLRTPRPDILSVPPNENYYDGLREAESKFPVHPGNSIVGIADSISSVNNNDLDSAKQNYRPPTSWSTGNNQPTGNNQHTNRADGHVDNININNFDHDVTNHDNLAGAASQGPGPTFRPTPEDKDYTQNTGRPNVSPPTQDLSPPLTPSTTTTADSEEFELDIRMKNPSQDPIYNFIKRFDPNSPESHKTAMTRTEIINLNQHLPDGQISAEDDRTPRRTKNTSNRFNTLQNDKNKDFTEAARFDTVNIKPSNPTEATVKISDENRNHASAPDTILLPPKEDYSQQPSTTMGPPIYYEWKWAVPAFDLEPPKMNNETNTTDVPQTKVAGKRPFSDYTRPTPRTIDPTPSNTEYNVSSYFIPDYVFPLDKPHPGYDDEDAQTSFQVKVSRPGRASFGENPACPQCHPAYLNPGSCEPCIVKR